MTWLPCPPPGALAELLVLVPRLPEVSLLSIRSITVGDEDSCEDRESLDRSIDRSSPRSRRARTFLMLRPSQPEPSTGKSLLSRFEGESANALAVPSFSAWRASYSSCDSMGMACRKDPCCQGQRQQVFNAMHRRLLSVLLLALPLVWPHLGCV